MRRYCILAFRGHYLVRCPVSVRNRICPLYSATHSFYKTRKKPYLFLMETTGLDLPKKSSLLQLFGMILLHRPGNWSRNELVRLVVILDYMGCTDTKIWTLMAQSIVFDALDQNFVDVLDTIALYSDYAPIANLVACSAHPLPLYLFPQDSDLHRACVCIACDKTPESVPNDVLRSVPMDICAMFPEWNFAEIMKRMPNLQAVFAGGAITGLLAGFKGTDIDLFVWNANLDLIRTLVGHIEDIHQSAMIFVQGRTISIINGSRPMQIIPYANQISPVTLVHNFDLDPCCCFVPWREDRVYLHPRASLALETKSMDLRNSFAVLSQERVDKYMDRGFKLKYTDSGIFMRRYTETVLHVSDKPRVHNNLSRLQISPCPWFFVLGYDSDHFMDSMTCEWITQNHTVVPDTIRLIKPWCRNVQGAFVLYQCVSFTKYSRTTREVVHGVSRCL